MVNKKDNYGKTWAILTACQAEVARLEKENKLFQDQIDSFRKRISKLEARVSELEEENAQLRKNFFDICDDCVSPTSEDESE